MAAYLIATVAIGDPEKFKAYADAIAGLAETYGGDYIVRGPLTDVLEGAAAAGERVVVVKFPDEASARGYVNDPAYLEGKRLREGAADVVMRLVAD